MSVSGVKAVFTFKVAFTLKAAVTFEVAFIFKAAVTFEVAFIFKTAFTSKTLFTFKTVFIFKAVFILTALVIFKAIFICTALSTGSSSTTAVVAQFNVFSGDYHPSLQPTILSVPNLDHVIFNEDTQKAARRLAS
ncbi:hypothetical protein AYO20_10949 [Fonsecaea nubica]|uniref:Uncharacterized protein n=1 Tax=Fonsecaea nubica TaxID=856822 RepID=A0A178C1B3_9EURO|nr:hypothetical protein AYO20_10949 [Fonsecaea nubica]OAL23699.1 hypothetical protein AYO20_10949 [Fonsecaea nubica]